MTASKIRYSLIVASLIMLAVGCRAEKENYTKDPVEGFSSGIDKLITEMMNRYDVPGVAMALVSRGGLVWSCAYGYSDLKNNRRMSVDTVCRVESISKSVTAWGVLKLAEKGLVDLDAPVQLYLADWEFADSDFSEQGITVRRLLSHNAGMPLGTIGLEFSPYDDVPSLKESLSKEAYLAAEPGTGFSYSNTGFNLLELIIEEVTGRDFSEYMKNEVLIPLGMIHSGFVLDEDMITDFPSGYDLKGAEVPLYVYSEKASGGLYASVEDIALFIKAGMVNYSDTGNNVLNYRSITDLYKPVVKVPGLYGIAFNSYGLGHFIEYLPEGLKAVSHGGQGHGWMTHFHFIPETGDGIVILTNSQRSWPLIAGVLAFWSGLYGFGSTGMEKIILGQYAVWFAISVLLFLAFIKVWFSVSGITKGKLSFIRADGYPGTSSLIQLGLSLVLIFGYLWSVNQDYFFLFSLFPAASIWLERSVLILGSVLFLSFLFPRAN